MPWKDKARGDCKDEAGFGRVHNRRSENNCAFPQACSWQKAVLQGKHNNIFYREQQYNGGVKEHKIREGSLAEREKSPYRDNCRFTIPCKEAEQWTQIQPLGDDSKA